MSACPNTAQPLSHLPRRLPSPPSHPALLPPGLTGQVGDSFALNCLGEGEYSALMKHFLQRFPAGADRFEGVDWFPAPSGSPVLRDAIAYMECK